MKNYLLSLVLLGPVIMSSTYGQNVGVGTNNPLEKLHVAGSLRVDDLQTSVPAGAVTDKVVWVDASGKVYSFPAGAAGKILGVNGAGVLAWLNPGVSNALNNGQIWIGDATNTPVAQTPSGDALIDNAGVITIQDNAVDGTDITISAESNGSLMYFDGTNWVNLPIGAAGQVLVTSGGVPTWVNANTLYTAGDLTTTTSGVTVTGGTGAVLGAGTTVNVATNALNQNGLVTGPTAGNSLQVWGTNALGNPGWVAVSTLLTTRNVLAGVANNAVSITNGTGQVVGAADMTVNVATNALNQAGVVTGTTAANANQVWGTDALGNPAWITPTNDDWHLTGNAGTSAANNFVGTTDAVDFVTRTNNAERMRVLSTGNVGIGTSTPLALLQVFSTGANWDLAATNGDFYVGNATNRFKLGVATGGGGAGDVYMNANGGTNRIFMGGGNTNTQLVTIDGTNNRVGLSIPGGNGTASKLDINGDLALREGTAMTVATGSNALTLVGENSHYRLTGAAGAFNINTIAGGNDGQLLTLINATGQTMTLNNNNAANGILTGNGVNMVSNGTGNSSVTMIYNATLARWIVTSASGMLEGNAWNLTGNAGTNATTNFIGTTDNVDLVTRTNNTEKMRVLSDGRVGIGTASSAIGTTYGFEKIKMAGDANTNDVELEAIGPGGFGPFIVFAKSNGTYSTGTRTIVNNGDQIGNFQYNAYDGTAYRAVAHIIVGVDGATGANDIPTHMRFHTSLDGTAAAAERMRITNAGFVGIGTAAPTVRFEVQESANNAYASYIINNAAAGTNTGSGLYTQTAQSGGVSIYSRNLNASGTAVFGSGNGIGGTYLTAGSGGSFSGTGVGGVFWATAAASGNAIVASGNNEGFTTWAGGAAASLRANNMAVGAYFTTGGVGRCYYGQENFGAFWNIGYWSGTTYYKIIGNGSVSTVVKDVNEKPVVMACPEAPENLFMDMGQGQLVNGKAHITIDPNFAKNIVVNEKHSLRVFIQLEGDCKGVFVTNKSANGFDVQELANGNSNTSFTWQIYANRADEVMESGRVAHYSDLRFPAAPEKLQTIEQESKTINPVSLPNPEVYTPPLDKASALRKK